MSARPRLPSTTGALTGRILVLEADPEHASALVAALRRAGLDVALHSRAEAGIAALAVEGFDVVLTAAALPDLDGLALTAQVVAARPGTPVIVLDGSGTVDGAVAAIRAGAADLLAKPVDPEGLVAAVARALARDRREAEGGRPIPGLVGDSPPMRALFEVIARVARTDSNVWIHGESGTGKELVARALHEGSDRRGAAFVPINCAALPEQLLESELFGHVRGAFTDARAARGGLFARAHGGTLFLDEIGDLSPGLQARLLRAVQERRIRPVGADDEVPVDVRIVAATHRDLDRLVEQGRFRSDLAFRLDVIRIEVPPLRARGHDVLLLARHFLDGFARRGGRPVRRIASAAAERLLAYGWPGNVRELHNCVERAVALTAGDTIEVDDLPPRVAGREPPAAGPFAAWDDARDLPTLDALERRYLQHVLAAVRGNKSEAARVLGLHRRTLYRKLAQLAPDDVTGSSRD